jgi:pyrroline-5-carboxylate reductase
MRISVIGDGRMGRALAQGWAAFPELRVALIGRAHTRDLPDRDVVVLAVKPKDVQAALAEYRVYIGEAPVVSVAAGVRVNTVADWLGRDYGVARAMPNICAAVGASVTSLCLLTPDPRLQATLVDLFARIGPILVLPRTQEDQLDTLTALAGSGPAYVFEVVESLAGAGTALGLSPDEARRLAAETVRGAAMMMLAHPDLATAELVQLVASPGGTTEAALAVLHGRGLRSMFHEALARAAQRAEDLARVDQ